MYKILQTVA